MSEAPEETVPERSKGLEEDTLWKDEHQDEQRASSVRAEEMPVTAAVSDRAKCLQQEAFTKKDEGERPKSIDAGLRGSVSDRAKWLKEEAFKKRKVMPVLNESFVEAPWNNEQNYSNEERPESSTKASQRTSVSELSKWLKEEEAFRKQLEADERPNHNEAIIERGSVSDRAKWLKDEAFKRENAVAIRDDKPVPPPPMVPDPNTMTPVAAKNPNSDINPAAIIKVGSSAKQNPYTRNAAQPIPLPPKTYFENNSNTDIAPEPAKTVDCPQYQRHATSRTNDHCEIRKDWANKRTRK